MNSISRLQQLLLNPSYVSRTHGITTFTSLSSPIGTAKSALMRESDIAIKQQKTLKKKTTLLNGSSNQENLDPNNNKPFMHSKTT